MRQLIAKSYLSSLQIDGQLGDIMLEPHQVDAAARILELLRVHGGAVLADATGMGKTFVALAVSRAIGLTTIVAPAALKGMWQGSLARSGVSAAFESYESLSRSTTSQGVSPSLLILDEAHHVRNPASKRYARIADLAWGANVLIMTATPIHNRGRDLRALLALFIGSRAESMTDEGMRRYIVRRTSESLGSLAMPALEPPIWLEVPRDPATLRAIEAIPPAVPALDGSPAHALMILGLIRAWSSSEAALRATLKRRLRRVASFFAALDSGHFPACRELESWPVVDDAIQLGFPALCPGSTEARVDVGQVNDALVRHQEGVRDVLRVLDRRDAEFDRARAAHLLALLERHAPQPVVAFSQFADTARGLFLATAPRGGVALVTGTCARVASGPVAVDEMVRGFDIGATVTAAMPLELLVTTDVLSEGLSLRRAAVIVHLDVPWTLARLEQRVGRLRRLGSPHRCIHVYAIGPPLEAAELTRVLRALQRKARLTTNVVGAGELQATLPLLGDRLLRATARVVQRQESTATERLRTLLGRWFSTRAPMAPPVTVETRALALMQKGEAYRLLAVCEGGTSDRIADVSDAVALLEGGVVDFDGEEPSHLIADHLESWIDVQRARDMVRPAIDAPSPAHVGVLRALLYVIRDTPRADRGLVSRRIEHCRSLVSAARGIGVELAMDQLLRDGFRIDALEHLLASRPTPMPSNDVPWRLVAVLESVAGQAGVRAFIAESPHPGPPRSSTLLAAHGEVPG